MALSTKINFLRNLPFLKCIYCKQSDVFLKLQTMKRQYSIHGFQSKRITKLAKKDNIPNDFRLVYQNSATKMIHGAQLACYVLGGAFGLILMYHQPGKLSPENIDRAGVNIFGPQSDTEIIIGCVFIAITCIAINIVCFKSPLRLYSDGTKFIGVKSGILGPFKSIKFNFNAGECKLAPPSKLSIFNSIRYKVGNKEYYIFEHCFKTNVDFNRMIGTK